MLLREAVSHLRGILLKVNRGTLQEIGNAQLVLWESRNSGSE
jgi:hypothetical protein